MPIKNYAIKKTSTVSKYVAEITDCLVSHGAVGIQTTYDSDKRVSSIDFAIASKTGGNLSFRMPCEWRKVQVVLIEQGISKAETDEEYCYRVAWANIKDWVLAQMALYETAMADVKQLFLPFAVAANGRTLSELLDSNPTLLLGSKDEPEVRYD